MKANRKFVTEEEAVSPVIAVILMVAITVVLAATVFVLVSDIGGQQSAAPAINFATDETQDRLVVNSADSRADWSRIEARAGGATVAVHMGGGDPNQNSPAATGGPDVAAAQSAVTGTPAQIRAGDYLEFCEATAAIEQVTITLIDIQANSKIGDYVFSDIALC